MQAMKSKVVIKRTLVNGEPGYVVLDGRHEVARVLTRGAAELIKDNREEMKRRAERHPMEERE